jgi:hypothetical protein
VNTVIEDTSGTTNAAALDNIQLSHLNDPDSWIPRGTIFVVKAPWGIGRFVSTVFLRKELNGDQIMAGGSDNFDLAGRSIDRSARVTILIFLINSLDEILRHFSLLQAESRMDNFQCNFCRPRRGHIFI